MSAATVSSLEFDIARCSTCNNIYNRTNRAPISMPCGHTFCHGCIRQMTTETLFLCGVCQTVSSVGWNGTKKNVALIKALERLNSLASDDTDEVLDSSPLGFNELLKDKVQQVDPTDMIYHGKRSLEILSDYLELRYGMFNGAVKTIKKAAKELDFMLNTNVDAQAALEDECDFDTLREFMDI